LNQFNDAIVDFYYDITPDHQFNDTLFEALGDLGFEGALQDRQMAWLSSQPLITPGTLNDMLLEWAMRHTQTSIPKSDRVGQINDQLLEYYDGDQPPGPGPDGELVTYLNPVTGNASPVWYLAPTDLVIYHA